MEGIMSANSPDRPNLVVMICHDLGRFLGSYGRGWIRSPHIDSIAESGIRFSNYFCSAPQCSPSRAAMWTGHAPHANGVVGLTHGDFANDLNPDERHLAQILGDAGYETHLFGGQHEARSASRCGFGAIHRGGSAAEVAAEFAAHSDDLGHDGVPFFAEIGFFEPHRGFPSVGVERIGPSAVKVPDFLPDIPEVRNDLEAYEASIATADNAVGAILEALKRAGHDANTYVVFTSDHGCPFPGAKMTLYDPGIEIPLILSGPGITPHVSDALLSNLAFVPTMLEVLGVQAEDDLHDVSFAAEMGEMSDADDRNNSSCIFAEKTYHTYYDPMRCVRTPKWKLIANFEFAPTQETPPGGRSVYTAVVEYERNMAPELERPARHPSIELYDLESDPLERTNLADDPEHRDTRNELIRSLRSWMEDTEDPLLEGATPQRAYIERMQQFREI